MVVYKDECVFTFDNIDSSFGVDVCLKCYIGTSPHPEHDFTAKHSRLNHHTAFLNIKRITKPTPAKENVPKKLAIHAEDDNDKYEYIYKFKTLSADQESEFLEQIQHVIQSESYSQQKQSEEWQLELESCEHVRSLKLEGTENRLTPEQLSKCSDPECSLTSNLWLCLHCGNLGCGRKQYDGSGGNNHAINHFEKSQHPLAVKLGTISAEGHADLYCYACEDDRLDPLIGQHLRFYGIDVHMQKKTEKSMLELQLEQNANAKWSFDETGDHVSDFTGMKNLGNTCYLNSVVQSLFAISDFTDVFKANDPKDSVEGGPLDLRTQVNKMKDGLLSNRYDTISPQMFKHLVAQGNSEFMSSRQQDAYEFFTYFVEKLEKLDSKNSALNVAESIFGFQTERRLECLQCHGVRYVQENQLSLSVPCTIMEDPSNPGQFVEVEFSDLVRTFCQRENIELQCPNQECPSNQFVSQVLFKTFPRVFVASVRKFRVVNWVPQKVEVPVATPEVLDLSEFKSKGPQPHEIILEEPADTSEQFVPDEDKIALILSMGVSHNLAVNALEMVKDASPDTQVELALNMIFAGDVPETRANSGSNSTNLNSEDLALLQSMGFTAKQAEAALKSTGNSEQAVEWLCSGNYDTYVEQTDANPAEENSKETSKVIGTNNQLFSLQAVVCHRGLSVHTGHYVAAAYHTNKSDPTKGRQLYLFNDEKVTLCQENEEFKKTGYVYLFKSI
ncbi:ubiquitin-specific protease [Starmerella bacillaris]|uniref:Ubiquitin carboxyl-terminal hydrolase n=1 Tax=Starmerella bacillaris TaxID=1247836 RepID=A0AAV5RKK2_STABA|nr:ubiquitin-specific protease [Starmerella bacillaris]